MEIDNSNYHLLKKDYEKNRALFICNCITFYWKL